MDNTVTTSPPKTVISARDLKRKLFLSRKHAEEKEGRNISCPNCGFSLLYAYSHEGVIAVKCQKCKFNGPLDLAYFRTVKGARYRRRKP